MNVNRIFEKYQNHTQHWILLITALNEKQYTFKPSPQVWSVSELADHLVQVTHKCLNNAQRCADEKGETNHRGFGPALFSFMGSFPPVKLRIKKIPAGMERIYQPVALTKEEALQQLAACSAAMQEFILTAEKANRKQRISHWAGGWFNAQQWYHSAEMHLKHHFRQFRRLEKRFPG